MKELILGSSSPRRQAMLKELNIPFSVRKPDFDESSIKLTDPLEKVEMLAKLKAKNIPLQSDNEIILTADTIVAYENEIFEKPENRAAAYHMIANLSGNTHHVITAVALRTQDKLDVFSVQTEVSFWNLSEEEINSYIATTEPYDKAGGYGIQGKGGLFVKEITGDYFNVVGLPVSFVVRKLDQFGLSLHRYVFTD